MTELEKKAWALGEQLKKRGWSITCAESCTGGGIGYAITAISGSSAWFNRGFITYSNQAKMELIGVEVQTLEKHGAVSEEVAGQMAAGAASEARANMALSVTGIAGPSGGSEHKPVGTVCFGLSVNGETQVETRLFSGGRQQVREQTVRHALELALKAVV